MVKRIFYKIVLTLLIFVGASLCAYAREPIENLVQKNSTTKELNLKSSSNLTTQGCCGKAFVIAQNLLGTYKIIDYYDNLDEIETVYAVINIKKINFAPLSGNFIDFTYDLYYENFISSSLQAQDQLGRVYERQVLVFHEPLIDLQAIYSVPVKFKKNKIEYGVGYMNTTNTALSCDLSTANLDLTQEFLFNLTCGANYPVNVKQNSFTPVLMKQI